MSRSHDSFGVGAGEGLAAVCGHQSGDEGAWAAMPSSSLGDRSNRIETSASRHRFRFIYGRDKRGRSREKRQECRFPERLRQARPLAVAVERGEIRRVPYQLED